MDPTQRGTPSPAVAPPSAERVDPANPADPTVPAAPADLTVPPDAAAPAAPTAAPVRRCANCDEPAPGKFCPECGQETRDPRVTFRALFSDFLDDYLSLDSRLFRSLVPLLFKPGQLTAEYLAGRRKRFIRPLRLYLVSSVLFFLLLSAPGFTGGGSTKTDVNVVEGMDRAARTPADADAPAPVDFAAEAPFFGGDEDDSFLRFILETVAMTWDDPDERLRYMAQEIRRLAPRAVFAMLPVFALLLTVLYRRSGRYYVEHFVFALHLHAFVFLLLTAALFNPIPRTGRFLFLWAVIYIFLALRRVYGGSVLKTGFKYVFLLGTYFTLQASVLLGIIITVLVRV